MKKKIVLLLIVMLSFVMVPLSTQAKSNDKITIYMFRGKGCGYCRSFLNFLSSINPEYGKYFELKSYEVWYDENNGELMSKISTFLEQEAGGVPYIIIGDKVFAGYASSYDDQIKTAIKNLYETKKSKRYDVMAEYEKKEGKLSNKYKSLNLKKTLAEEGIELKEADESSNGSGTSSKSVIFWNLGFIAAATCITLAFVNKKFNKLEESINSSIKKLNKPAKK